MVAPHSNARSRTVAWLSNLCWELPLIGAYPYLVEKMKPQCSGGFLLCQLCQLWWLLVLLATLISRVDDRQRQNLVVNSCMAQASQPSPRQREIQETIAIST
ncbi:hypothetical protein BDW75DRAFT_13716 [Aspergillus navahoensis]